MSGFSRGAVGAKPYNSSQLLTTSGTFTVPAGVTRIRVTRVGGGAGFSSTNSTAGGNGHLITTEETVAPGQVLTVAIGAGGAQGAFGAGGGNTTITGLVAAKGGQQSSSGGSCPGAGGPGWGSYGCGGGSQVQAGSDGAALFEW